MALKLLVHHLHKIKIHFIADQGDLIHKQCHFIKIYTSFGFMKDCQCLKNTWIWTPRPCKASSPLNLLPPHYWAMNGRDELWISTQLTSSELLLKLVSALQPTGFQSTLNVYSPRPVKSLIFFFSRNDLFNITDINIWRKTGSGIVFVAVLCYNITRFPCWQCRLAFSFPDH